MFFNHSERAIRLPRGTRVGIVTAANFIPNKIAPKYTDDAPAYAEVYAEAYAEEAQKEEQAYAGARAAPL